MLILFWVGPSINGLKYLSIFIKLLYPECGWMFLLRSLDAEIKKCPLMRRLYVRLNPRMACYVEVGDSA